MKHNSRRGQGAMEYLMTYGWAILVVMLVGVAMWQMGIFNLGGSTGTTASGFPRIKPLLSTAVYTAGDDDFSITFANGAGGTIYLDTGAGDVNVNGNTADCLIDGAADATIRMGETLTITCDFTEGDGAAYAGAGGDPYVMDVSLAYQVTTAGQTIDRTDSGIIRGPMEP